MEQRGLVELARHGDHDAFAVLVVAAVPRLDRIARLIVRDPELARDAVQESLIAAWRDLRSLRDPDRFDAWIHRLTVRSCVAIAERQRRRSEVDLAAIEPADRVDVAKSVAERELLDRALRGLDPQRRALIVLHVYAGFPLPEVAEILGMPLGTAKSRLSRALAALRVGFPDDRLSATSAPTAGEGRSA